MNDWTFSEADILQIRSLGLTEGNVLSQIERFEKSFFVRLNRPATAGDGVLRISPEDTAHFLARQEGAAAAGRFVKFVPASGAATRMFQSLLQIYYMPHFLDYEELHLRAEYGVAVACDFVRFIESIRKFAFVDDLEKVVARDGISLDFLILGAHYRTILDYLLMRRGLDYSLLPKALLRFHRYPDENRTALEEHLVESIEYLQDCQGSCSLHFTLSPEHEKGFLDLLDKVREAYEDRLGCTFDVGFSFQKTSSNTIAVDSLNRPFREFSGKLHFRPAGHGALLDNLNDLEGDLVYIKNIDNLAPDRLKGTIIYWKKVLGGVLVSLQQTVHEFVRLLRRRVPADVMADAAAFARNRLGMVLPADFQAWDSSKQRDYLLDRLNRPIRVCGVVPNQGEPGGAPFWVEDADGGLSLQIVEKAQVDHDSPEQERVWVSSTHFNPVDIVCGLRDWGGRPFDLRSFVDDDAIIVTRKSKDGKELKALELPGLWNGAMARWITVFVEVPAQTFTPVKTVYDLLKPEHEC